jgi:hypothetical protein
MRHCAAIESSPYLSKSSVVIAVNIDTAVITPLNSLAVIACANHFQSGSDVLS